MRATVMLLLASLACASVAGAPAAAAEDDLHRALFACTTCHVTAPGSGDTLASAPLVLPRPELCLACHGDTHGE